MAVFMINICKFDRCGIIFKSLADLIQHIEENHIDNESSVLQYNTSKEIESATCLPLSYVLRFYTNKVKVEEDADDVGHHANPQMGALSPASETNVFKIQSPPPPSISQLPSPSIVPAALSCSPPGSEPPSEDLEEDSMLEDSNDSWTLAEEYSSEYILKHGSKMTTPMDGNMDKPFACPVPGCKKRYKNVNGIKYHSKNGHKTDGRIYKNFKCHCGKSYKTSQGLKTHTQVQHGANLQHALAADTGTTLRIQDGDHNITTMTRIQDGDLTDVLQVPSSRIKALTLKHIEALGVPVKTFVLNRTPPPSTTTGNINILSATCVKPSDSNNNTSNVLEINTSLHSPLIPTLSPNGKVNTLSPIGNCYSGPNVALLSPSAHTNPSSQSPGGPSPASPATNDPTFPLTPNTYDPACPMSPNTPTTNSINPLGFVHTSSSPISIPNVSNNLASNYNSNLGASAVLSSLLTPATSPSSSPVSSLSSYHSL